MFLKNRKMVTVKYLKSSGSNRKDSQVQMFESTAKALIEAKLVEQVGDKKITYTEFEKERMATAKKEAEAAKK